MKKLQKIKVRYLLVLVVISIISVCCIGNNPMKKGVKGNGNVEKETRKVGSFNQIKVDGVFHVYLSQAKVPSVVLEADNNLFEFIQTEVKDNKLSIKIKKGIRIKRYDKMNVYVTIKNINRLESNIVGNLECLTKLNLTDIDIINSGVGNVSLKISASDMLIKNSGVGNINTDEFDVQKIKVNNNGVGNINLKGSGSEVSIKNSGVGNVNAYDLTAQKVEIHSAGVGNVKVTASEELDISSSGVGNVFYKGEAVIKKLDISGVGRVKKKD